MKKLKLSQWHDGKTKPKHIGWYQRNWYKYNNFYDLPDYYAWWDGKKWSYSSSDFTICMMNKRHGGYDHTQDKVEWRGVLK